MLTFHDEDLQTWREAIESFPTHLSVEQSRKFDTLLGFKQATTTRIILDKVSQKAIQCTLPWSGYGMLSADDGRITVLDSLPSSVYPPGRFAAIKTPTRTLFAIALSEIRIPGALADFTLSWLPDRKQYALIYNRVLPDPEDEDEGIFRLEERHNNLPTTTIPCSIALLKGDLFSGNLEVDEVDVSGFIVGIVERTDAGLEGHFGQMSTSGQQQIYEAGE